MSPAAAVACKIISAIRRRELREVWTKDTEQDLACQSDEPLYPGMMFHLARERMEKTDLWKIIEKMPKGLFLCVNILDYPWLRSQLFPFCNIRGFATYTFRSHDRPGFAM